MVEMEEYGTANSAFWVCLIFFIFGMDAALGGYRSGHSLSSDKPPNREKFLTQLALRLLPATMIIIAIIMLIIFKGPVILGVNRVAFWQGIAPDWARKFPSLFGQSFILIPMLYYLRRNEGKVSFLAIMFAFIYLIFTLILLGEKFSTFILYITTWTMVAAAYRVSLEINIKTLSIFILISLSLYLIITYSYETSGLGSDFIFSRIALQGQLIWSVMNEEGLFRLAGHDWSCYFGCDDFEKGTQYISAMYMPYGLFMSYEITGSGLTGYLPALPILAFGIVVAFIFHVLISYLLGYIQGITVQSFKSSNIIVSVLMFKVYIGLIMFWYSANVYPLRGVFLSAGALLVISAVRSLGRRGSRI